VVAADGLPSRFGDEAAQQSGVSHGRSRTQAARHLGQVLFEYSKVLKHGDSFSPPDGPVVERVKSDGLRT
jgi:hypothetical protein